MVLKQDKNPVSVNKVELLSPAGDYECFMAAIKAGADAVYAGGSRYGARAYALNFTQDELLKAIDKAHINNRKLYLTVNTVIKNEELDQLYDYIEPLYRQGLDGVIVQDMGAVALLKECFPGLPLHASTQMAVTGSEGVKLLMDMGICRVVPARELDLAELRSIREKTGVELECFIHGALCYSYSGKCLFSSMVGKRSGNRGRCAQPCRLPYDGKYIMSAKDICTVNIIPRLIEAGISSFKIEGRMKSKEYVASVTGIYRKYIDAYYDHGPSSFNVSDEDLKDLTGIYTRSGHCEGYYDKHNGREMITINKPSYATPETEKVEELYQRYTGEYHKLPVKCVFSAYAGSELTVSLMCGDNSITYTGDITETAANRPTDEANIRKHLDKDADEDFRFEEIEIYSGDDVFLPVSAIKNARRKALNGLRNVMLEGFRRSEGRFLLSADEERINRNAPEIPKKVEENNNAYYRKDSYPVVNCRIDDLKMLSTVIKYRYIDIITVDINAFYRAGESVGEAVIMTGNMIAASGKKFFIALPYVIREGYFDKNPVLNTILCDKIVDGVTVDNYEALYFLKSMNYKGTVVSDLHLYAVNDRTVQILYGAGVDVITYPVELNKKELNRLDLKKGEFIIYGRTPMMISAQCIQKTKGRCVKDNGVIYIKDRLGNSFPVECNCTECFNTVLNCVPTMIASFSELPANMDPASYRIHFTVESEDEMVRVLDHYRDAFAGTATDASDIRHTTGHLKRGVE